jgi:anaerobic magnesium-protoporphyrin IX monomethyl ester cyclase
VELAARFDVGDVNFQDETFFTDRRWCLDLAERLASVGRRFSWAATMRADQGCRMNDTDFSVFRSSGLRKLLIGVESGSPRILERLGKDITREQVLEVADRLPGPWDRRDLSLHLRVRVNTTIPRIAPFAW